MEQWNLRRHPWDGAGAVEAVSAPSHARLKDLHAYWLGKKGDRPAPPRAAIRPEEIPRLLPYIALLDVIGEPTRFRFRLFGTALVQAYGDDLTGRFADEVDLDAVGPGILAQFTTLTRDCRPMIARVRFTKSGDGRYVQYERIGLPLSDDGQTVNMILAGYVAEIAF